MEFGGTTLNLVRSIGDQRAGRRQMSERTMSDEFDGLDATEKAGIGATLIGVAPSRPKLGTNSVTINPSTSLTSCRWQTFTPRLSA